MCNPNEAMRSRLDDLSVLVGTAEGKGEGWADPAHLEALGIEDVTAIDNADMEAEQRLREYPFGIESTATFEIVLGPDDRLLIEYQRVGTRLDGKPDYETPRRVLYRYSNTVQVDCPECGGSNTAGSGLTGENTECPFCGPSGKTGNKAEIELVGEDREVAEAFARRVVPGLAE